MEEKDILEQSNPIDLEEFKQKIHGIALNNKDTLINNFNKGTLYLRSFQGVRHFKSIRRAIKRGHVSVFGDIYPKRPFNNRKRNYSSSITNKRRQIYGQLIYR